MTKVMAEVLDTVRRHYQAEADDVGALPLTQMHIDDMMRRAALLETGELWIRLGIVGAVLQRRHAHVGT